ncbi:MAG: hypothetical protein PHN35_05440 [Clostridia bacterium]|nr:hypothetical protein [Clostridia bacterium]MDD4798356.1 hypothetical protein [Clostridia bacterium]
MDKVNAISWQQAQEITNELLARLLPMTDKTIAALDAQNGIYIISYEGKDLVLNLFAKDSPRIVYVGISKENSSRHFISGNTGKSTMRRSLAALLQNKLDLVPVPRSLNEKDADRYSNYALDSQSEEKLTEWMRTNFKCAFYQTEQIKATEAALVNYIAPLLNFQHNPGNKYGAQLKNYRKQCAEIAKSNEALIK